MKMKLSKKVVGIVPILVFLFSAPAAAAYTVTPETWNIIGLDSNTPTSGPNRFPVGAKVCGGPSGSSDTASFTWDSANSYVYLRAGSANPVNITFGADGCADAYFEVEVDKTSGSAPFDTTSQYHITAGGVSTPTPRELYVEHLISQSRNGIDNVKLNGVSIPAGGSMNLMVGNTYTIELDGHTAPGGYNQFEEFINFQNTIFQIQSVSTTYTMNTSPYVPGPNPKPYADACRWENDPNSPYYRSCWEGWKSGDTVVTTYTVKILSGGGSSQTLNSLLYDFSGSSFHYNADYSTGARFGNIIDPAAVTISKSFSPNPTNAGGVSTLTFTLTNPNAGAVSGLNFTDTFPISPGAMVVDAVPNASTTGCGTPTFAPVAGAASISFSNGTIAANSSCTVQVNITPPATGTYNNTSGNLFVGTLDTGHSAAASLTVNSTPPPPAPPSACASPKELARWTMDPAQGTGAPPLYFSKASDVATATASYVTVSGTNSVSTLQGNPVNSWGGTAPTGGGGWAEVSPFMNNYFQFELDTSKYGGVRVTFDAGLFAGGDWATPTSPIYVNTSADGAAFVVYTPYPTASKGGWAAGLAASASATGTDKTRFRFSTSGSGSNKPAAQFFLDNVIFTGCVRPDPPTMTKSFSPNPVAVGATSTLTFNVVNPNLSAISGIAFTDTLPSGLTVTTGSSVQCGGTLTRTAPSTLSFSGGTLAASANCNITATVTATTAGPHNNVSGPVSATESGANNTASGIATASLTAVLPPAISKLFAPNPILANGVSTLTFTITNPNQNNALSGVAFTDTFPATMVVANPTGASTTGCGAPTYAPVIGAGSISFTSGTLAAAGTCTVTVNVTVPATGTYANTSANVSHLINAATVNGNTASNTLTVSAPNPGIAILKQISTTAVGPWTTYIPVAIPANVYYRFTVENFGDVDLTSVHVDDPDLGGANICTWANLTKYNTVTCTTGLFPAVAGFHINTATASGTYGVMTYTDWSVAAYATTGLTITKSATETYFTAVGNVLHYSYVVKNTGSAPLLGPATVADDKSSNESCPAISTAIVTSTGNPGDGDNYLDGGEQITCTATYTVTATEVTAGQVTNVASATIDGVTSPTDTKTVSLAMPSLTLLKTVQTYSDPINGTNGPKAIPGSEMVYTIIVTNSGAGAADNNTTVITDPVSTNLSTCVSATCSNPPVTFSCSVTPACGLSYNYATGVTYSNQVGGGTPYTYTPTPDGSGYDGNVTGLRINPTGVFNGTGGGNPSFTINFKAKIK